MTIFILFIVFSLIMLSSAFLMALSKNSVNAACFMIVSLIGSAGLFALLNSWFLALLQILVYAGAVMVLFLFVVMLINEDNEKYSFRQIFKSIPKMLSAGIVFLILTGGFAILFYNVSSCPNPNSLLPYSSDVASYARVMFTKYMLVVQLLGMLLFVSMLGVIVIAKKPQDNDNQ